MIRGGRIITGPVEHIGDWDGRIALWLNEQSAHDLADCFSHEDLGRKEILDAIERAYPEPQDAA